MIKYLQGMKDADASKVSIACEALSGIFDVSTESTQDFKDLHYYPSTMEDIFKAGVEKLGVRPYQKSLEAMESDQFTAFVESVAKKNIYKDLDPDSVEYMTVHAKVMAKYMQKKGASGVGVTKISPKEVSAELAAQAEEKKNMGNNAIQKQNYNAAVRHYSDAIDLVPDGPQSYILYSNRAAAYCYLTNYDMAVEDCNSSIALNDKYCKAYSRLGLAHYHLENYQKAMEAYSMCVDLEPKIKSHKDGLMRAKQKLTEKRNAEELAKSGRGAPGAGGLGGLDPAMMQNMLGGAGGGGLSELLANPQMKKMAQEMANNPAMLQQAMSALGSMGGGGGGAGGMPDMSALASMMGGLGNDGSSSSSGQK